MENNIFCDNSGCLLIRSFVYDRRMGQACCYTRLILPDVLRPYTGENKRFAVLERKMHSG